MLEGAGEDLPVCTCHRVPKAWHASRHCRAGGYWSCAEQKREQDREWKRERRRLVPDYDRKSNEQRIFIGSHYAGRESQYPYRRDVVERHLSGLYDDFRTKQAEEHAAFREALGEGNRELAETMIPSLVTNFLSDNGLTAPALS